MYIEGPKLEHDGYYYGNKYYEGLRRRETCGFFYTKQVLKLANTAIPPLVQQDNRLGGLAQGSSIDMNTGWYHPKLQCGHASPPPPIRFPTYTYTLALPLHKQVMLAHSIYSQVYSQGRMGDSCQMSEA